MCMEFQRKPWRTSRQKTGGLEHFEGGKQEASGRSVAEVLPAHDAESISSSKAQHRLREPVNRVRHERYVASLEQQLPVETTSQRGTGNPQEEKESKGSTEARQRSQSGPGAPAFLRARPVDWAGVIPPSEFVTAVRWFLLEIEEFLVARCPSCGAAKANTRHARLRHRSGARVDQHPPLVHALSRTFKRVSIRHQMESGAPPSTQTGISAWTSSIEARGLRHATASEYRNK